MPELPEVESVRRVLRDVLQGRRIARVELGPDDILLEGLPPEPMIAALHGRVVSGVGRRGKFWWLEFNDGPWVHGHLGMTGWIREIGKPTVRLKEMGKAPLDDEEGRPRFLRLLLETDEGRRVAFTDARRLGRLWLGEPGQDRRVAKLGRDAYEDLPTVGELVTIFKRRKAPLKVILMDQGFLAGIGNYLADEIMYQARISPHRVGTSLTLEEIARLRAAAEYILETAVSVHADYDRFPEDWLFHHRWGGSRGSEFIGGHPITRDTIGGRTTAWIPDLQK